MLENESDHLSGHDEEESALPDWAIAVIVIGLGSLAFVIIFGITVVSLKSKDVIPRKKLKILLEGKIENWMGERKGPAI